MVQVVGVVVIGFGLLLIVAGVVFAWQEFKQRGKLGPTGFVDAVRRLVKTIAESKSPSLACFAFGTILVVLGGVISGVGGLT